MYCTAQRVPESVHKVQLKHQMQVPWQDLDMQCLANTNLSGADRRPERGNLPQFMLYHSEMQDCVWRWLCVPSLRGRSVKQSSNKRRFGLSRGLAMKGTKAPDLIWCTIVTNAIQSSNCRLGKQQCSKAMAGITATTACGKANTAIPRARLWIAKQHVQQMLCKAEILGTIWQKK
jgi:hypothetical protein